MKKLSAVLIALSCSIFSITSQADSSACRTITLGMQSAVPGHSFKIPVQDGDYSGFLNCDGPNEAAYLCHGTLPSSVEDQAPKRESFVFSETLFMGADQEGHLQAIGEIQVDSENEICND